MLQWEEQARTTLRCVVREDLPEKVTFKQTESAGRGKSVTPRKGILKIK